MICSILRGLEGILIPNALNTSMERASYESFRYRDQHEWITNILETGANPNSRNESGYTPLMVAISHALNSPFVISRKE